MKYRCAAPPPATFQRGGFPIIWHSCSWSMTAPFRPFAIFDHHRILEVVVAGLPRRTAPPSSGHTAHPPDRAPIRRAQTARPNMASRGRSTMCASKLAGLLNEATPPSPSTPPPVNRFSGAASGLCTRSATNLNFPRPKASRSFLACPPDGRLRAISPICWKPRSFPAGFIPDPGGGNCCGRWWI